MTRRLWARRDAGSTLPELLVSMIVFAILGGAVTITVIATMKSYHGNSSRATDLNGAQNAVDAMSKLITVAAQPPAASGATSPTAIISAGPSDLTFYALDRIGLGPSKVRFYVNSSNQLVESETPATGCTPPFTYGTTTSRVLANGVTSGSTIFTYLSAPTSTATSGTVITPTGTPAVLPTPTTAPGAWSVELITINLSLNGDSSANVTNTSVNTTVSLPNHLEKGLPGNSC